MEREVLHVVESKNGLYYLEATIEVKKDQVVPVTLDEFEFMDKHRIQQIQNLSKLKHAHLVQVWGISMHEPRVIIDRITSNMHILCSMQSVPFDNVPARLPLKKRIDYCCQLVSAVAYLHKNQIVHRAIKPTNVFLCGNNTLKLGGLWHPEPTDEVSDRPGHTVIDVFIWNAPELRDGSPYSYASDIYSCGMVMYFILTGKQPYDGVCRPSELLKKIEKELPQWNGNDDVPKKWIPVIESCWSVDPDKRPCANDLNRLLRCQNKFLTGTAIQLPYGSVVCAEECWYPIVDAWLDPCGFTPILESWEYQRNVTIDECFAWNWIRLAPDQPFMLVCEWATNGQGPFQLIFYRNVQVVKRPAQLSQNKMVVVKQNSMGVSTKSCHGV